MVLTYIYISGNNTITGDIANAPVGLTYIYISGQNTITGDIANAPVGLTYLALYGSSTITGDLAGAPAGLTVLILDGFNTITGNLADAPADLTYLNIIGHNIIADYTSPRTWAENQSTIQIAPVSPGGLSTSEVDALLHDLAQVTTWTGDKLITLTGTNQPRSSASDADVTTLTNAGVTVTTNT